MDFELSAEQEAFRKVVRDFAEAEIAPHAEAWDRDHTFPVDTVLAMGELGLFGLVFPEEYGGVGGRLHHAVRRHRGDRPGRPDHGHHAVGRRRPRRQPDLHASAPRSRRSAGCPTSSPAGPSAPSASPSPTAAATPAPPARKAVLDEATDEWVIDGVEGVHHQLGHADHVARHGDGPHRRPARSRAIVVPAGTPGLDRRAAVPQDGLARLRHPRPGRSTTAACRPTTCSASGARASGTSWPSSTTAASPSRPSPSGWPRPASSTPSSYAKQRNAFGGPIGRFQAIAFALADLAVAVENARNLTYKAAWLKDHGRPFKQAAAMAKLYATEAAVDADPHRHAGLRRLRLHRRDTGQPLLPRRQDPRDRRGHERDPAPRHRAASACRSTGRWVILRSGRGTDPTVWAWHARRHEPLRHRADHAPGRADQPRATMPARPS